MVLPCVLCGPHRGGTAKGIAPGGWQHVGNRCGRCGRAVLHYFHAFMMAAGWDLLHAFVCVTRDVTQEQHCSMRTHTTIK